MPPAGVKKGSKRARQYAHIRDDLEERGERRAEEIAARTVNKQRAQEGETKSQKGRSRSGGRASGSTREELYRQARRLGIAGRSKMNKRQLAAAVARKQ